MIDKIILDDPKYDFIKTNKHLGDNICLLTLGGSHAHGTNIETSDIDIRGIAINSCEEILLGKDFEEVEDDTTDTVIYSLNKMIRLLCQCNPNCIEILGCKPEHYFKVNNIGLELIKNKEKFLSKRCIYTFGGYAKAQLNSINKPKSKRNKYAVSHGRINKHAMHLIRLYMTGIDILESHQIITYREKEHDLLMSIRNGDYLNDDKVSLNDDFFKIVDEYDKKFKKAAEDTTLPNNPDMDWINKFLCEVNANTVCHKYGSFLTNKIYREVENNELHN